MRGQRGFNLAEVMIALMFVSLAIFSMISVTAYCLRAARESRGRQIASVVASTQMSSLETRLKVDFNQPIAQARSASLQFPDYQFEILDGGYENAGKTLRAATINVYWKEDGYEHNYPLAATFYYY